MLDLVPLRCAALVLLLALSGCRSAPAVSSAASASGVVWIEIPGAGYALARTEITVGQYAACVADGACASYKLEGIEWKERPWSAHPQCLWGRREGRADYPMNCVDWHQANDFCAWVGGRLPTKEEFIAEASNGGQRPYPWGDAPPTCDLAVMNDWKTHAGFGDRKGCGTGDMFPVCSRPAGNSAHGLCDVGGNVTEWTTTQELSETPPRFNMGGSYTNSGDALLAKFELINPTSFRIDSLGARCLKPN